jgi:hypothetical protein
VGLIPVLLIGAVSGVLWALRRRAVLTVNADEHADVAALHRYLSRWRWAGLIGAVVLTVLLVDVPRLNVAWTRVSDLGRVAALVPAFAGLSLLLGTIIGELTARPPKSAMRTATVETRRVKDILPRRLTVLVTVGALALIALLTLASMMGSPDDLGRPGRWLTVQCPVPRFGAKDAAWMASSSNGPWPGSFYAVPVGIVLCVVLVAAAVALAMIVRRPRPTARAASLDMTLRRHAGRNVILALGVVGFATLGPIAVVMGDALGRNDCGPTWWAAPAWALGLVGVVSGALATWCALRLLINPVLRITEPLAGHHEAQTRGGAGS